MDEEQQQQQKCVNSIRILPSSNIEMLYSERKLCLQ
jgi:hypothetical protein